ncbi:MAG: MFS transporter [Hyphomicrobiaceae bacterium]|nr:MFS transporter [Hyphomicrobiaceae bacterium]
MSRDRVHFLFINAGHFLDHLLTLVFATVAALALSREWGMSYAALIPYATPGFIAFGVFALPAGWLADRWSREGMMAVFFIGIGLAAVATSFARTPVEMGLGLFVVGVFAAIYHPVGLALLVERAAKSGTGMLIGINGVWGNLGVASAALITGYFVDHGGWRLAFVLPGLASILIGLAYIAFFRADMLSRSGGRRSKSAGPAAPVPPDLRVLLIRLSAIIFFTTAVSGIVFQSTTFALPKVFEERLTGIAGSATLVGWLAFLVFAIASVAQVVVGRLLDLYGPRNVFLGAAAIQIVFFATMPGLADWAALLVALAFMLGAFGQIPINDYMIGKLARSDMRASIYGVRYIVTFVVLAATLPLIAWIHQGWGFDRLFQVLAAAAGAILVAVWLLPRRLPDPEPAPAVA